MENNSHDSEGREEAMDFINKHELLSNDPYAKRVAESGLADNGEPIDVRNFLAARAAVLEKWSAEEKLSAAEGRDKASYDVAVIHSVRPDLEEK